MTAFRFPLEKVLEWRRRQLELEEARVKRQLAVLAELDRARTAAEQAAAAAETQVRRWPSITGRDLGALADFRLVLQQRQKELAGRRAKCQRELATCQQDLLEARRRCRLLERLREKILAEWQSRRDRELEELALESHLAQWGRREGQRIQ